MDYEQLKDISGWVAFLVTIWYGGRAFMALAREFKDAVVLQLKELNKSVRGQDTKINGVIESIRRIEKKVNQ